MAAQAWELSHYFGPSAVDPVGAGPAAEDAAGCRVQLSHTEQREWRWSSRGPKEPQTEQQEQQLERPRSAAFCNALQRFLHTGACWMESGVLSADTVSACRSSAISHLTVLRAELGRQKRELLQSGNLDPAGHRTTALLRCDFAELTERDGGRVDMRYRMNEQPFSDPSIVRTRCSLPSSSPSFQLVLGTFRSHWPGWQQWD